MLKFFQLKKFGFNFPDQLANLEPKIAAFVKGSFTLQTKKRQIFINLFC